MHDALLTTEEQITVNYYNKNIQSYIERTFHVEMEQIRNRFLKYLPQKAKILDAGCGPGRDAVAFSQKGYEVLGFDAAIEMVRYVKEELHIPAVHGLFQEMQFDQEFDGIWASASLVHISPTALPDVLERFHKALKPKGILAISFKDGVGVKREGERTFTYMNAETLLPYLGDFTIVDQWIQVPEPGVNIVPCNWLNTILRKKNKPGNPTP